MTKRIDTQARNESVRLEEQGGDPAQPAAGYRIVYAKAGGIYEEDDAGNVVGPLGAGGGDVPLQTVNGRLTLTTGVPVTTADVTAAATLYFALYKGNQIALYDGAAWQLVSFTEKSLSLVGYTASKPYDIWGYIDAGTLALDSTIWTNATTRATALAYQDGVLIKTGDATRRYLGTIYINASGAQTDDSVTKRFVYNYYNQRKRLLLVAEATNHTYNGAWRKWNNSDVNNLLEYIVGVQENSYDFQVFFSGKSAASGAISVTMPYLNGAEIFGTAYTGFSTLSYTGYSGGAGSYSPTLGYSILQLYQIANNAGCTFVSMVLRGNVDG